MTSCVLKEYHVFLFYIGGAAELIHCLFFLALFLFPLRKMMRLRSDDQMFTKVNKKGCFLFFSFFFVRRLVVIQYDCAKVRKNIKAPKKTTTPNVKSKRKETKNKIKNTQKI